MNDTRTKPILRWQGSKSRMLKHHTKGRREIKYDAR